MLTIDDKYTFKDFGLIPLQDHVHPMTPQYSSNTLSIPGRPGMWDFGEEIGTKEFEIPLGLVEYDRITLQAKLNKFVEFLFDERGKPREFKAVFDYEPDKYYIMKVRGQLNPERIVNAGRFGLALVAYDPYKYAGINQYDPKEDYNFDSDYQYDTGLYYDNPLSFDWLYSKHYSGINNYSHLETELMIEIVGTVTDPSISNTETGSTLTLPSINNGRLLVNGKTFTVYRNGQDILDGSNYNFFNIQPGEVGFLFEGENPNATVNYKWLHKFM